jgi:hypothetical protein
MTLWASSEASPHTWPTKSPHGVWEQQVDTVYLKDGDNKLASLDSLRPETMKKGDTGTGDALDIGKLLCG